MLRTGNKAAAVLTLLGDAAKGWLAMFSPKSRRWRDGEHLRPVAGVAAFLGHLFPVFLRFKGGKGVATALGVLIGLDGWIALGAVLTWAGHRRDHPLFFTRRAGGRLRGARAGAGTAWHRRSIASSSASCACC